MAKKWLMSFSFVCSGFVGAGQEDRIDTDRPDQTESAGIVPKNYFQAEVGFKKRIYLEIIIISFIQQHY